MKEPAVEKRQTYRDLTRNFVYVVISVACPFIAAKVMTIYQNYSYGDQVGPRVEMKTIETASWLRFFHIQDACAILIGLAIGSAIAVMSLRKRPQFLAFAMLALLFNVGPFFGRTLYSALELRPSFFGLLQQPTVTPESLFTDYVTTTPEPVETLAPGVDPTYQVEVEDQDGIESVTVRFSRPLPAPEIVDTILRDEIKKVVKRHPEIDVQGNACAADNSCLTENDYSGDLVYKAAQKKIITTDEDNGVTSSGQDNGSYYVLTELLSPPDLPVDIKPVITLILVFPEPPRQKEAYEAIIAEVEKIRDRHHGVMVQVKAGDRNKRTSWYEVKGNDGNRILAIYDPAPLDKISTKTSQTSLVLKQF